jgi:hypothetical protein
MPQDVTSGHLHFHLTISFVVSAYTITLPAHCHGVLESFWVDIRSKDEHWPLSRHKHLYEHMYRACIQSQLIAN